MSKLEYERNKTSFVERKLNSRSAIEAFKSAYKALEACVLQNYGMSLEEKLEQLKKNKRESVFGTFHYQLSHCGIKKGLHSVIWFGDLSYSKLKMEKEPETNVCPVCKAKLRPVYYYGLLGAPPPEGECEMFVDPDGWHVLENNPRLLKPITKEELEKKRIAKYLHYANKGVCFN